MLGLHIFLFLLFCLAMKNLSISLLSRGLRHQSRAFISMTQRLDVGLRDAGLQGSRLEIRPESLNVHLKSLLDEAPKGPGIYKFLDRNENILYIGKSVNVFNRVKSYFRADLQPSTQLTRRIAFMTQLVHGIQFETTPSATDALILESSLVRLIQPPFNVLLKDDKRYPYIVITYSDIYPKIFLARQKFTRKSGLNTMSGEKDVFIGPFVDGVKIRSLMQVVKEIMPLQQRPSPLYKDKPCLNYHIGRCPGVCQSLIAPEDYRQTVRLAQKVFEGNGNDVVASMEERENLLAAEERFEEAIQIRDASVKLSAAIKGLSLHFSSSGSKFINDQSYLDVIGVARVEQEEIDRDNPTRYMGPVNNMNDKTGAIEDVSDSRLSDTYVIQVIKVRNGRVTSRMGFTHELEISDFDDNIGVGLDSKAHVDIDVTVDLDPPFQAQAQAQAQSLSGSETSSRKGLGQLVQRILEQHYESLSAEPPTTILLPMEPLLPEPEMIASIIKERLSKSIVDGTETDIDNKSREIVLAIEDGGVAGIRREPKGSNRETDVSVSCARTPGESHLVLYAEQLARKEAQALQSERVRVGEGLLQLAEILGLSTIPTIIEGYDVSHLGGTNTVASKVVFSGGLPDKGNYRRYKLKSQKVSAGNPDDYESIREVISRRFLEHNKQKKISHHLPDLIVIDGGKGQLSAAVNVLEQLKLEQSANTDGDGYESGVGPVVISLAKREEEVFAIQDGVIVKVNQDVDVSAPVMRLLRYVRDEAHYHALAYQRSLRQSF
jgi:excinuclease ABC subunit C